MHSFCVDNIWLNLYSDCILHVRAQGRKSESIFSILLSPVQAAGQRVCQVPGVQRHLQQLPGGPDQRGHPEWQGSPGNQKIFEQNWKIFITTSCRWREQSWASSSCPDRTRSLAASSTRSPPPPSSRPSSSLTAISTPVNMSKALTLTPRDSIQRWKQPLSLDIFRRSVGCRSRYETSDNCLYLLYYFRLIVTKSTREFKS